MVHRNRQDMTELKVTTEHFINRELSWLEFNDRVLQEGKSEDIPLLERLKFLAIVSSNLDEFFMIRVAGLMQQVKAGVRKRDISGLTPSQQLDKISRRVHQMKREQTESIKDVFSRLSGQGIHVLAPKQWSVEQRYFLQNYFVDELLPVLTPVSVETLDPVPLLPGLQIHIAANLAFAEADDERESPQQIVVVPVPTQHPRFVSIPGSEGISAALLEDVVTENLHTLFPDCRLLSTVQFRLTRDADVDIQDDEASDLLNVVENAVLDRRRRGVVRLVLSARPDRHIKKWLVDWLAVQNRDLYEIDGMLDPAALMELANMPGFESLKNPEWPPQHPVDIDQNNDIWQNLIDHDVMLFHPYESFQPVIDLVSQAADDPNVIAIKQTLYRTSGDSPIISALQRAAESGKQVTVLVELKARFDEARNVNWARRLENAGCLVIYGVAGLKTHAKALLIVRRENGRIRRYVHLATGNYNDKTAKLYSDIGMMTTNADIATDVASFFNILTGYSEVVGWSELVIAPTDLKRRFLDLIDREIQASTPQYPGHIMAKVNSLQDEKICKALYQASQAGVQIQLNVRGICCLRPGLKGFSDNIEVISIIDRYLEHARVFYFRNGGHEELYMSSADWMTRNLDKRLELLFPVTDNRLRRRLVHILEVFFRDNVKARRILPDGRYERVLRDGEPVRAQETFYREAIEAVQSERETAVRFQPLMRPQESGRGSVRGPST